MSDCVQGSSLINPMAVAAAAAVHSLLRQQLPRNMVYDTAPAALCVQYTYCIVQKYPLRLERRRGGQNNQNTKKKCLQQHD